MKTLNRFFICCIIFCFCGQAFSQSYLKFIDTKKSKVRTILPGAVLAFTSSQRFCKCKINKSAEYDYRGTFRYMEDSNMVFTLNDAGSISGTANFSKNDTTLYKFKINEIKRIRIVFVSDETFWSTHIFIFSILLAVPPVMVTIDNTKSTFGYNLLMAAGAGVIIGFADAIIEDLIFPHKPRKIIGKRYKLEIHQIEPTKFYVQP